MRRPLAKSRGKMSRPAVLAFLLPAYLAVTWALLREPLAGAAVLYVTVFVWLSFAHPNVAMMLTFASAPLQNDVSQGGAAGARFSIAEVNLALLFGCFIIKTALTKRRVSYGPAGFPILIYLTICIISSILVWRDSDTIISFLQMIAYFVLAVLAFANTARDEGDFELSMLGLIAVAVFLSLLGVATHSPTVLGIHKNGLGASLATAFVVAAELWLASSNPTRRKLLALAFVIITAGLLNTLSRGAWLGACAGLVAVLAARREARILANTAALMIPIILLGWAALPQDKKQYVTELNTSSGSGGDRMRNARTAEKFWRDSPLLGQGVGLRKQYDATNITLFTLAETGVVGLAAFLLIHLVVFRMVWLTLRVIRPTDPAFSYVVIAGALLFGKLVHAQLDHYWSRGSTFATWAAVGMATYVSVGLRSRIRAQREVAASTPFRAPYPQAPGIVPRQEQ